jgi:hypothetical protein
LINLHYPYVWWCYTEKLSKQRGVGMNETPRLTSSRAKLRQAATGVVCSAVLAGGAASETALAQNDYYQTPIEEEQDYDIPSSPTSLCVDAPSAKAQNAVHLLTNPSKPHGKNFRKVALRNGLHPVSSRWLLRRLDKPEETSTRALKDNQRYLGKLGIGLKVGTPDGYYQGFRNPNSQELKKKNLIPRLKGIAKGYTYFTYEYVHDLAGQKDLYLMAQKSVKNTGQADWDSDGASQLYLNINSSASDMPSTVGHELFHPVQKICGIEGIDEAYDELDHDVQGTSLFEAKPELDRLKRAAMTAGKTGCAPVAKWSNLAERVVSTTPYGLHDEKTEDGNAKEDQAELAANLGDPAKLGELFEYPILREKIEHIMARIYDYGKTGRALVRTWAATARIKRPLLNKNNCDIKGSNFRVFKLFRNT